MSLIAFVYLSAFCLAAINATGHQNYPGTTTRPILSASEAAKLDEAAYLQGWKVEPVSLPTISYYVVGSGKDANYTDIQKAINAAINDAIKEGSGSRKYIKINPGTYKQTVFISGNVPLTIYGSGNVPSDVNIILNQPATLTVSEWIKQVNPNGNRYQQGDPAYKLYQNCAKRTEATIGTSCSSIFRIQANNTYVHNLQVTNSANSNATAQAVALQTNADKIILSKLSLISGQDTLYLGNGKKGEIQRVYVNKCYIEGDVDFIFGSATAILNTTVVNAVSHRHPDSAIFFAPDTPATNRFGFLVINSNLTGDSHFKSTKKVSLARSWDAGTTAGQYKNGTSPNGQVTIRNSFIDPVINVDAPYSQSTSSRPFSGNVDLNRNLNDNNHNRMWEFKNSGEGA